MKYAAFFRDIPDYYTLRKYSSCYYGVIAKYNVISVICLEENVYQDFCSNMCKSHVFLLEYCDAAVIRNGVWHCIMVTNRKQEVLVVMNHYHYPRFVAIKPR